MSEETQHPVHAALINVTDGLLREIVELHHPHRVADFPSASDLAWLECYGCDSGPHADGNADWPCSTIQVIAERLGVSLAAERNPEAFPVTWWAA